MASTPSFAVTSKVGTGAVSGTASTSFTSPSNPTTIVTGASGGTKIEEIIFQGIGTTVAGTVNVFVHDGTNYSLIDQVLVTAITSSTTAAMFRARRQYQNLILPSTSWTLRVSSMVASQLIQVSAFGADF
jgi:hypothetical protein